MWINQPGVCWHVSRSSRKNNARKGVPKCWKRTDFSLLISASKKIRKIFEPWQFMRCGSGICRFQKLVTIDTKVWYISKQPSRPLTAARGPLTWSTPGSLTIQWMLNSWKQGWNNRTSENRATSAFRTLFKRAGPQLPSWIPRDQAIDNTLPKLGWMTDDSSNVYSKHVCKICKMPRQATRSAIVHPHSTWFYMILHHSASLDITPWPPKIKTIGVVFCKQCVLFTIKDPGGNHDQCLEHVYSHQLMMGMHWG